MRTRARDHTGAEYLRLVAPQEQCGFCLRQLGICETRVQYVQTLDKLLHVVGKGKKCSSPHCGHGALRYRSPEVGRLVLKGHEFGRDVVTWAGDQHIREKVSIPRIHKRLVSDFRVPISERSVGNLVDDYVALCACVAGDTERLRERLRRQRGIVLCVDGVHFDEGSPVLYVQRDVISGEVLYAERRLARSKDDLIPMLKRSANLAADIGVRILGIASDKEKSLVPAIADVFPGIPHQFCQTHFLKNVAEPLKEDDQELARGARETVLALRKVQRTIERRFPEVAVGVRAEDVEPRTAEAETPQARTVTEARALEEAKIAAALARAGTTVGVVSGRSITDPPGLKRFQRLEQVREAANAAARRKGAPKNGWALIDEVREAFLPLELLHAEANRLDRHVEIVRHVAHLLDTDKAASQVKRVLRRYLNRLEEEAPRRGRGAQTGHFIDHLIKTAESYWGGLFHTYDHPEIPGTTNSIEGFFGSSKHSLRSTTGRRSTAGGKMESSGEFVVQAQTLMGSMPKADLERRLSMVPDADFAASKRRLRRVREPARERRSIQRDPDAFLARALAAWQASPST